MSARSVHPHSSNWGVFEAEVQDGQVVSVHPYPYDAHPSPLLANIPDSVRHPTRISQPMVRAGWLDYGAGPSTQRGKEPFVLVSWETATDLLAAELRRVSERHGPQAIYGGSYGWSSAGRFHHAQSQVKRFLNCYGGFVRHQDSYSLGAARVLMPHVVAPMDELMSLHTRWDVLARDCKLFVAFGGVPRKNAQINAGGATLHHVRDGLYGMSGAGVRFVNVTPTGDDLEPGGPVEWLAIRPNTDAALMLALCHVLYTEKLYDRAFL